MPAETVILVTGNFVAREGRLADAIALSLEHVRRSRAEPGCISHAVHQDVENPSRLVFVEQWSDEAALAAHFAVPASRGFIKAVMELATAPPTMDVFVAQRR